MNRVLAAAVLASALAAPPAARADHLQNGIALYEKGKYADAVAELRQAQGAEAQAYLGASLAKQKKYGEAEPPARAAVEALPTHPVAVAAIGEALVGQRKLDDAVSRMSAAIGARDDLAYAYFWRGQAYAGKKQTDKMVADFEKFLELAPNAPEAPTVRQLLASLR